jgi:hypothetical protein
VAAYLKEKPLQLKKEFYLTNKFDLPSSVIFFTAKKNTPGIDDILIKGSGIR